MKRGRDTLINLVRTLSTVLLLSTLLMRVLLPSYASFDYEAPGYALPTPSESLMVSVAVFAFCIGTWLLRKRGHTLLFQTASLLLLTTYDFKVMWQWGLKVDAEHDFLGYVLHGTLPGFWATVGVEAVVLVLCLAQFLLARRRAK